MKKDKPIVKLTEIGNMPTGSRFIAGGHSSLMIASNAYQTIENIKYRMCISENGSAKWIPIKNKFMRFERNVVLRFTRVSKDLIDEYMAVGVERKTSGLGITLDTPISSAKMYMAIGERAVNVLVRYAINELLSGDENKDAISKITIKDIGGKLNIAKLSKYRGCGEGTLRAIKHTLKETGIKVD